MDIVVATNNRKKLEEIRRIMADSGHNALSLAEAGVEIAPVENGETYAENALIKAHAACQAANLPAIADDSGLEVDALDGAPGIKSARFAGLSADDDANNQKLVSLLERIPFAKRGAHFLCVIALVTPNGGEMTVEGLCDGVIGFHPSGENGFGYDPYFYHNNRSFADMTDEEKDKVSHRALALQRLMQEMPNFLARNT